MADPAKDIEDDLTWRMDELAVLKLRIAREAKGSVGHSALLRSAWVMLYAHYEGFCLNAINVYLGYLVRIGVSRNEVRQAIRELSLDQALKPLRGGASTKQLHDFFVSDFQALLASRVDFPEEPRLGGYKLRGRNNLYPADLRATCESVCLDHAELDFHQARLRVLVLRRNSIAHGRDVAPFDLAQLARFEEAAIAVMHDLALNIIDAIENKRYLRPSDYCI